MELSEDKYRYVLDRPLVNKPGEKWIYNGGATAIAGKLIADGSGMALILSTWTSRAPTETTEPPLKLTSSMLLTAERLLELPNRREVTSIERVIQPLPAGTDTEFVPADPP